MPTLSMTPTLHHRSFSGRPATTVGLGACKESGVDDASVIALAMQLGCTVIDTAPHYHKGAHERAVGEAVRIALDSHAIAREQLIISTKVGRIPELVETTKVTLGFARLRTFIEERFITRGLFAWDDLAHSDHTFAPAYLRHSVAASLERLGVAQLDCVFLDAPELQQQIASPTELARRMLAAFETMEALCAARVVRCYGVATASCDLGHLVTLARGVAGDHHHFAAAQLRLSMLRQDALATVARAADLGLHVYVRGCLDGGAPGYQLPDAICTALGDPTDAAVAIRWAQAAPGVGTALFGSRDPRHIRANLAAARLPLLDRSFYTGGPS